MKAIRLFLLGFLLLLVGATVLAQFQRADWRCERSIVVPAPVERVHAWLDDLEHWPALLTGEGGPPVEWTVGAQKTGPGAVLSARSTQGSWTLQLVRSDPVGGVEYQVDFPGGSNAIRGSLRGAGEGGGTRITLQEGGEVGWGPIERFLRGVVEKGHAEELGRRLERLERALASGTPPAAGAGSKPPAPPASK